MKFQPEPSSAQTIRAYGPGWIGIDAEKITTSIILGSGGLRILIGRSRRATFSATVQES